VKTFFKSASRAWRNAMRRVAARLLAAENEFAKNKLGSVVY
jgi:hypothetical protein